MNEGELIKDNITNFMSDMGIDDYKDINSLYQDYIYECNQMIMTVNENIKATDCISLEKIIHNIKGVSANLYVKEVYNTAKILDDYLKLCISKEELSINNKILSLWSGLTDTYKLSKKQITDYFASAINN